MKATKQELCDMAEIWNKGHYSVVVGEAGEDFVMYVRSTDPLNEDNESHQKSCVRDFVEIFKGYDNVTVKYVGRIYAA